LRFYGTRTLKFLIPSQISIVLASGESTKQIKGRKKGMFAAIRPAVTLLLPCLDDYSAFSLFATNKQFHTLTPSYPIKKVVKIELVYFNKEKRTSKLCSKGEDNVLFPTCLFGQVTKLEASYDQLNWFLFEMNLHDIYYRERCFLRHVTIHAPYKNITVSMFLFLVLPKLPSSLLTFDVSNLQVFDEACVNGLYEYIFTYCPKLQHLFLPQHLRDALLESVQFPESLQLLSFFYCDTYDRFSFRLPQSLLRLEFRYGCGRQINEGILPDGLQELDLGDCYDFPLPAVLPTHLRKLTLNNIFNHPLPPLPPSLQYLDLGDSFNQPLIQSFPSSLKTLIFGCSFNQSFTLGILNEGLERINLNDAYNKTFTFLPSSLLELSVGEKFNRRILPGSLPCKLQRLVFGNRFNHKLDLLNNLPSSLTCLVFPSNSRFTHRLRGDVFPHLKCLLLPSQFSIHQLVGSFPSLLVKKLKEVLRYQDSAYPETLCSSCRKLYHINI
jgi:FNIP Repeat